MPKINFSNVQTSFAAREAGEVEASFSGYEYNAASQSSGQPTIKMVFNESENPDRQIHRYYSLQPKALWSLKRDMIHMGASIEDMNSEEADLEDILDALIGASVVLMYGEPTPATDKAGKPILDDAGNQKMYDSFKGVKDPTKVGV